VKTYKLVAAALLAGLAIVFQLANDVIGIKTGFGMTVDLVAVPILLAFFILGFKTALDVSIVLALAIALTAATGYIGAVMKFAATLPMITIPALYALAWKGKINMQKALSAVLLGAVVLVAIFAFLSYPTASVAESLGQQSVLGLYLVGLAPVVLIAIVAYALVWLLRKQPQEGIEAKVFSAPHHALLVLVLALLVRGVAMVIANFYFAGPLFFKIPPHEFIAFIESQNILFFGKGSAWYAAIFFWNAIQGIVEFAAGWIIAFKLGFAKKYAVGSRYSPRQFGGLKQNGRQSN